MTPNGKHVKDTTAPRQVHVGKHGVAFQPRVTALHIALAILIVTALCAIPFSFAAIRSGTDSAALKAFADPARTAFPALSDTSSEASPATFAPEARENYTSYVTAKLQNAVMSGGCELVSLGIASESMGIDFDLSEFADSYLDVDGHFATGYSGDPYSEGAGYPPGLATAANKLLADMGSNMKAHDLTGASQDEITSIVNRGYPVLVWTTMDFDDPAFSGVFDNGHEWYENEHCVVLYGFEGSYALVSDPLEGLVTRDASRFFDIYAQCGSMALAIF